VPMVVLEHPSAVTELHREYLRAGSDIVEAFTYYAHREKLRFVGMESQVEEMNRKAIQLAKAVAAEGDALVAGNICNTNIWVEDNPHLQDEARAMFKEQVTWAKDEGVDLIIGETFNFLGEAVAALEVIRAADIPAVITMSIPQTGKTRDDVEVEQAMRKLSDGGAAVVGINCARGPATMLPLLRRIRAAVSTPIGALPVPYRTTEEKPTFQSLSDPDKLYLELEYHLCTRFDMANFAKECKEIGVNYLGICCGGAPYHLRAMAEAIGRTTEASKYSPDVSKHFAFGKHETFKAFNTDFKLSM